jgi:superfamily II DNA or RNA helicase
VRQTYEDYHNLGLDVGVYFGDEKQTDKTHTIATWQSLNVLDKRFKDGETNISLDVFSTGLAAIIVDEVHQAKADVLKKLLTGPFANVPIRWGLTGTVPKEDWQKISLEVSLGPVVSSLSAATLQDMGVLAECHVNVVQMEETAEYGSYQEELEYLTTNSTRLDYIADLIKNISDTGNTLVLVDRIRAGEQIVERIEDSVFVSGSMKSKDRKDEYDEVATATGKVIVATYGVAAVGINIPRIFNLVLLEPGKSFVRVIQSIGRGIRKAQDKDFVQIWDLTSTSKFSKRHLRERKKFYADAKYPYLIEKVDYRSPKKGKK